MDETPQQKAERERKYQEEQALEEFKEAVGRNCIGPADRHFQKVLDGGGSEASALVDHVNRRRAILAPDDFDLMPQSIQEYEHNNIRDAISFVVWKEQLKARIANGELPLAPQDVDEFDIVDMMFDVRAPAIRIITKEQNEKFEREFKNVPMNYLLPSNQRRREGM